MREAVETPGAGGRSRTDDLPITNLGRACPYRTVSGRIVTKFAPSPDRPRGGHPGCGPSPPARPLKIPRKTSFLSASPCPCRPFGLRRDSLNHHGGGPAKNLSLDTLCEQSHIASTSGLRGTPDRVE